MSFAAGVADSGESPNKIVYGLIVEEVAVVYPELVARDVKGEIQSVQDQKLTPLLLAD